MASREQPGDPSTTSSEEVARAFEANLDGGLTLSVVT